MKFNAVLQLVGVARMGNGRQCRLVFRNVHDGKEYRMQPVHLDKLIRKAEWVGPLLVDGLWETAYNPQRNGEPTIKYVPTEEA